MNNIETFKNAALIVLSEYKTPMHYEDILKKALDKGILRTVGFTPHLTMSTTLLNDTKRKGNDSVFYKDDIPGYYGLTDWQKKIIVKEECPNTNNDLKNESPNSKLKGYLGESRVSELLSLYGNEILSCYTPISDDEGIDIIVKKKKSFKTAYIQVKTSFSKNGFVATVKNQNIIEDKRMLFVFAYFDMAEGDIFDYIFCIPAPEFLKLTNTDTNKQNDQRTFTVGLKNPESSKYAEFLMEKRELANKVIEYLDKL